MYTKAVKFYFCVSVLLIYDQIISYNIDSVKDFTYLTLIIMASLFSFHGTYKFFEMTLYVILNTWKYT